MAPSLDTLDVKKFVLDIAYMGPRNWHSLANAKLSQYSVASALVLNRFKDRLATYRGEIAQDVRNYKLTSEPNLKGRLDGAQQMLNFIDSVSLKEADFGIFPQSSTGAVIPDSSGSPADASQCRKRVEELEVLVASLQEQIAQSSLGLLEVPSLKEQISKLQMQLASQPAQLSPEQENLRAILFANYDRWSKLSTYTCQRASFLLEELLKEAFPSRKYDGFYAQSGVGGLDFGPSEPPNVKVEGSTEFISADKADVDRVVSMFSENSLGETRELLETHASPILISTFQWKSSYPEETLVEVLSLPAACFTSSSKNPPNRLENTIASSIYYRTGFKLTFLFDANAHYCGRLLFSWDINGRNTALIDKVGSITADMVRMASAANSVDVDISSSSSAELEIPFASVYNYFATGRTNTRPIEGFLGNLLVYVLAPLSSADPTKMLQEIPVRIYASCLEPSFISSREPETPTRIIIRGPLPNPILGASRAEYSAQGKGECVLSAFDADLSQDRVAMHTIDRGFGSMDTKLSHYIKQPCLIDTKVWQADAPSGYLASYAVHPMSAGLQTGTHRHLSRLASTAMAFSLWRGDICFRFAFGASGTHHGRLLFAFQATSELPLSRMPTLESLTQMPSVIFDISAGHEITVRIPYASCTNYSVTSTNTVFDRATPGIHGIGTLHVYQLTPLASNFPTSQGVTMDTFLWGGDNFEFANLRQVRDVQAEVLTAQAGSSVELKSARLSYTPRDLDVTDLIKVPGLYHTLSRKSGELTSGLAIPVSPSLYRGSSESALAWFSRHYAFWSGDLDFHFSMTASSPTTVTIWHEPNITPQDYIPYYTEPGTYGGMVSKHVCHTAVNPNITVPVIYGSHFHRLMTKGGVARTLAHETNGMLSVSVFPPVEVTFTIHVAARDNFRFYEPCAPLPCLPQGRVVSLGNIHKGATPGKMIAKSQSQDQPTQPKVAINDVTFEKVKSLIDSLKPYHTYDDNILQVVARNSPLGDLYESLNNCFLNSPKKVHIGELDIFKKVLVVTMKGNCEKLLSLIGGFYLPKGRCSAIDILHHLNLVGAVVLQVTLAFVAGYRGDALAEKTKIVSLEMKYFQLIYARHRTSLESAMECLSILDSAVHIAKKARMDKATVMRLESGINMMEMSFSSDMDPVFAQTIGDGQFHNLVRKELDIIMSRQQVLKYQLGDMEKRLMRALLSHAEVDEQLNVKFTDVAQPLLAKLSVEHQDWLHEYIMVAAITCAEREHYEKLQSVTDKDLLVDTDGAFFNAHGDLTGVSYATLQACYKFGYSCITRLRELAVLRNRAKQIEPTLGDFKVKSKYSFSDTNPSFKRIVYKKEDIAIIAEPESHDGVDQTRFTRRYADKVKLLHGVMRAQSGITTGIEDLPTGNVLFLVCRANGQRQSALCLTPSLVVVTKHFIDATEGERISFVKDGRPYSMVIKSGSFTNLPNRDLAIIHLPMKIPKVDDITSALMSVSTHYVCEAIHRVSSFSLDTLKVSGIKVDSIIPISFEDDRGYILPDGSERTIMCGGAYAAATGAGDCGSPLVQLVNGKHYVTHIHVAGSSRNAIGYCEPIFLEDLSASVAPVFCGNDKQRNALAALTSPPSLFFEDFYAQMVVNKSETIPLVVLPKPPVNFDQCIPIMCKVVGDSYLVSLLVYAGLSRLLLERKESNILSKLRVHLGRPPDGEENNFSYWKLFPHEGFPDGCVAPPLPSVRGDTSFRVVNACDLHLSRESAAIFRAREGTFALKVLSFRSHVSPQWLSFESIFTILLREIVNGEGSPAGETVRRALLTHQREPCDSGGDVQYITSQKVVDEGMHPPTTNSHSGMALPSYGDPPPDVLVYSGMDVLT